MTIINQKSISGITSITFASAGDDLLTFHSNNGTERFRIDNSGNTKITAGIVTTLTTTGNATVGGTLGVTGETTFATHVNLGDSDRLRLGADNDLQIFHDGSQNAINSYTSNPLNIISNGNTTIKTNNNDTMAEFQKDGAVELYYDNAKKFETTSYGAQFTDNVKFDNPDTAGRDLTWEADNDALHWEDNTKATFGAGNDLQIYHNGSHSYIADEGTGELNISGSRIQLMNAARSEKAIDFVQDGAVDIYYDGSKKLETTSDGITVSGRVTCDEIRTGDDDKIQLGDSQDFRIYHDGSTNIIDGHYHPIELRHQSEVHIKCVDDGKVEIYHNNAKKFETGSGGAVLQGKLQAEGTGASAQLEIKRTDSNTTGSVGALNFTASDGHSVANIQAKGDGDNEGAHLIFKTTTAAAENSPYGSGTTERMRILSTGGLTFNGDTAAANALNDYEEGTWTPAPVNFDGTITINSADYVKVGKLVHINMYISFSNTVDTSNVLIGGLPYTVAEQDNHYSLLTAHSNGNIPDLAMRAQGTTTQLTAVYLNNSDGDAKPNYNHVRGQFIICGGTYYST